MPSVDVLRVRADCRESRVSLINLSYQSAIININKQQQATGNEYARHLCMHNC